MAFLGLLLNQFLVFVLVLTRLSGLVMTAPIFGSRNVPIRIRALLTVGLALMITPLQEPASFAPPRDLIHLGGMLVREGLLGLSLGLAVLILFAGLQLTGQIVGQMSGMALADVYDPSFDASVPVFSRLLDIVALSVFLAIGGHLQVLGALLDTFRNRPPGVATIPENLAPTLSGVLGESFVIGFRAAAPVMMALLMSILILGLISRTLPQLNVIAVGFSVNTLIMLAVLSVCLGAMVHGALANVDVLVHSIRDVWLFAR
jgi:flagellar biosynthetic protein FliR